MEYTVQTLAQLSGVSRRTLRYYDQIGLLKPERMGENGYRIYGTAQVDTLQQILFYKNQGLRLEEIRAMLTAPDFDKVTALEIHLITLKKQKEQIEQLIATVSKTICSLKGERMMSDKEKFEGFKAGLIEENEKKYGKEIRSKYGDDAVDSSIFKVKGMKEDAWRHAETLKNQINTLLREAMNKKDPCGEAAQKACALHEQWIRLFWKDGAYSKAAHRGLSKLYVSDERFKAYYDNAIGTGAAQFLKESLEEYTR